MKAITTRPGLKRKHILQSNKCKYTCGWFD